MQTTHHIAPPRTAAGRDPLGLDELVPLVDVVAVAGPPVVFLAGPWLLFGLMLAAPFAVALTLAVAAAVATLAVAATVAVLAAPFVLVRRLRGRSDPARPATPTATPSGVRLRPAGA